MIPMPFGTIRLANGRRDPSASLSKLVLPGRLERPHNRLGGGGSALLSYGKLVPSRGIEPRSRGLEDRRLIR